LWDPRGTGRFPAPKVDFFSSESPPVDVYEGSFSLMKTSIGRKSAVRVIPLVEKGIKWYNKCQNIKLKRKDIPAAGREGKITVDRTFGMGFWDS